MTGPRQDYRDWRALGPGGLPPNVFGWTATSFLRLLSRETRSTHPYEKPRGRYAGAARAVPWALPPRPGGPPTVGRHPVPHRQLDQLPDDAITAQVCRLVPVVAGGAPDVLTVARSRFERHVNALHARRPDECAPWLRDAGGEIGHVHPSDGSLHVVVHPDDAATLLRAGWAERHPLCGVPLIGLPVTYLLLYAPRTEREVAVAGLVLRRAAAWVAGSPQHAGPAGGTR